MKLLKIFVLFLFISACSSAYQVLAPISEKACGGAMSEDLLGKWYGISYNKKLVLPNYEFELLDLGGNEYLVALTFASPGMLNREETRLFKVWASKVNGVTYYNAFDLQNPGYDEETYELRDEYSIYKTRLTDSISLYHALPDSLKVEFSEAKKVYESFSSPIGEITTLRKEKFEKTFTKSSDFYDFIQKNQQEFDSAFNNQWFPFVRKDAFVWPVVNQKWKDSIMHIQVVQSFDYQWFKTGFDPNIFEGRPSEDVPKEVFFQMLSNSSFSHVGETWWKIKPKFYILKMKDGSYVHYAISKLVAYDFKNNVTYVIR